MNKIISIDLMGGDRGPEHAYKGAILFLKKNPNWKIIAFTTKNKFDPKHPPKNLILQYSKKVINKDKISLLDIAKDTESTLINSINATVEHKSDATISAGPSSVITMATYLNSKPIKEKIKPAFCPIFTGRTGKLRVVLDVGASLDFDENSLVNFAKMGSSFISTIDSSITNPSVALLNIGSEEYKGDEIKRKTYQLLKQDNSINFIGNIEPDKILNGDVKVIITDAINGNIALKTLEGVVKNVGVQIKESTKSPLGFLGILIAKRTLKKNLQYVTQQGKLGGAIVLGVNHIILKVHGSAKEENFYNALVLTKALIERKVIENIKNTLDIEK